MDNSLVKMVNPTFTFEFAGKTYQVRKATLDKAVAYQQRVKELKSDAGQELLLVAYCIYLILKDYDAEITEKFVLENTPADIDIIEVLTQLGFLSPTKMAQVKAMEAAVLKQTTGEASLS